MGYGFETWSLFHDLLWIDGCNMVCKLELRGGEAGFGLSIERGGSCTMGLGRLVVLTTTVVPEPSTALLLGFGLMALAAGRRRH